MEYLVHIQISSTRLQEVSGMRKVLWVHRVRRSWSISHYSHHTEETALEHKWLR